LAKEFIIDANVQQADPIDLHVGGRLKMRRIVMGLSQEKLAERLGITFQQIQKYERGQNRISAGRLFRLSQLLQVEVAYFFNDHDWAEQSLPANTHQLTATVAEDRAPLDNPDWRSQESMDLLRHYYNIGDRDLRKRVMEIVKSMAQHSSTDGGTGGSGSSGSAESSAA
jgi:transcriptional regulator with XRE-family HTH domain